MNILDTITRDLEWREAEIASMRTLLCSPEITDGQKQGLLRAAWALLYAHYEGFCKNSLIAFYDFIARLGIACKDLPQPTKIFAVEKQLKQMRKMTDHDLLGEIVTFESSFFSHSPLFPDVDTQSNLWPNVLIDLMETADLCTTMVKEHEVKLKTLVSRRNQIAHGENSIITEVKYYSTYEQVVYDVMYDLAIQIDKRLSLQPFVNHQVNPLFADSLEVNGNS